MTKLISLEEYSAIGERLREEGYEVPLKHIRNAKKHFKEREKTFYEKLKKFGKLELVE